MSVISRIESMMEDYSSAEKKLANYIIGNIEKVLLLYQKQTWK